MEFECSWIMANACDQINDLWSNFWSFASWGFAVNTTTFGGCFLFTYSVNIFIPANLFQHSQLSGFMIIII